MTRLYWIN
ncbi:inner membrane transport permease yadH, partial [Yersinia pestis PY-98]